MMKAFEMDKPWLCGAASLLLVMCLSAPATAQTGVDDDRVSLPEGPGSLEGVGDNVEIDPNMASMRYSIAVPAPAGFPGVSPNLSLDYSSSAPAGVVGVGWSIASPTIERMTSRGVPDYDLDDLFAADGGTELVYIGDDASTQVYRERFEKSFTRYSWVEAGTSGGTAGYWTAEYPDGTVGYFGADSEGNILADARTYDDVGQTYRYHLAEKVDPFGNKITYSYDKFGGFRPLLTTISYLFVNDAPTYTIELGYEMRPDIIEDCNAGFEELLSHRLTGVTVRYQNEIVSEQVIAYEDATTSGGFSRVQAVRQFGVGGQQGGVENPISFSFEYQRALGVECTGDDCDLPVLVDMAQVPGGVSLGSGQATLFDINGDGLPDILDTSQPGAHRFFLNRLTPNAQGGFDHGFDTAIESATATSGSFQLDGNRVQTLDINGDGYADLTNTTSGAFIIADPSRVDWALPNTTLDVTELETVQFSDARFFDYDNDKKIDVLISTASTTQILANTGTSFDRLNVSSFGAGFADSDLLLSDINGDGMNDVVDVLSGGEMRYRINLGKGKFTDWRSITDVSIPLAEQDLMDLEDLNGDGRDDVVIVTPTQVKYSLNRGDRFDPFVTITSADFNGTLPDRSIGTTVLYADMNANGSDDVVWFSDTGQVQYLELFPKRPNLMSRVSNGIGSEQIITYGTAAEHAARARAEGAAWDSLLQTPMPVVDQIDAFVMLTGSADGMGLHDIISYEYRNGFYDGVEKQFRGFGDVLTTQEESASQEMGRSMQRYDLGDTDPYFNGLLIEETNWSGERELFTMTSAYEECALDEVPTATTLQGLGRFPVRFICKSSDQKVIKEGQPESDWVTTRMTFEYDGYGNIIEEVNEGDIDNDDDNLTVERTFATPDTIWHLRLPTLEQTYEVSASEGTEIRFYYDGDDFEGNADGSVTHGFLSRQTTKVDDQEVIETLRQRRDDYGNAIETIDPRGSVDSDSTFRRLYTYDDTNFYLSLTEILLEANDGTPYSLRRESRYDKRFGRVAAVTDWMVYEDGMLQTARNETSIVYDDLGREVQRFVPGDEDGTPTLSYVYELGDPFSRISFRGRGTLNAADTDIEVYTCVDGLGREYQKRTLLSSGTYLVTGFKILNKRGAVVEEFQPYESDSAECDTMAPTDVASTKYRYDGQFRLLEKTLADESIHGTASVERYEYRPLVEVFYDAEDTDDTSPHVDTPTLRIMDGQERLVELQRLYNNGGTIEAASYTFSYDNTGSFEGYTDPAGNQHLQTWDLAQRIVSVTNPNFGEMTFVYDSAGNIVERTDARGITQVTTFDAANRPLAKYSKDARDETLISYTYDRIPEGCERTECTNLAGQLAGISFPMATVDGAVIQGTQRFGYDARKNQIFAAQTWGDLDLGMRFAYDPQGTEVERSFPDGTTMELVLDGARRTVEIPGFVDDIVYNTAGVLSGLEFANGARWEMTFDDMLRPTSMSSIDATDAVIESFAYTRDRLGNITQVDDMSGRADIPSGAMTFEYDAWYRLLSSQTTSAAGDSELLTYTYDELDNVLSLTSSLEAASPAHVGSMSYANAPNQVSQAGDLNYTYDAIGQMLERGEMTLAWDYLGRLSNVSDDVASETYFYGADETQVGTLSEDGVVLYLTSDFEVRDGVSFAYARVSKARVVRYESAALMTEIYPDLAPLSDTSTSTPDGEINAADAFAVELYGEALDAAGQAKLPGVEKTERLLGAAAARLLHDEEHATAYLHLDHLGSIVAATDEGGEVRGQRSFYPTGALRWEEGYIDRYGFTGQEHMDTGLVRFKFRHLDPVIARWTSFDPSFMTVDVEMMSKVGEATTGYAYVANNFINAYDPLGLTTTSNNNKKSKSKSKSSKKSKKSNKSKSKDKSSSKDNSSKPKTESKAPKRERESILVSKEANTLASVSNEIGQKGNEIGQKGNEIGQKANVLGEKANELGQKNNELADKGNKIGEKGNKLSEEGNKLAKQNNWLTIGSFALSIATTTLETALQFTLLKD